MSAPPAPAPGEAADPAMSARAPRWRSDDGGLRAALERFAATRARTLELLAGRPQEQLDRAPAAGRWSAGEVFDHLVLAERLNRDELGNLVRLARAGEPARIRRSFADMDVSVAYIPKAALPFLELPFTVANLFLPAFVRDVLARSRWLPAQNPTAATPRRGRAAGELRADLEASLAATVDLVTANADLDFRAMRFSHPLLGTSDGIGVLAFMSVHERRHKEQIGEALAAAAAAAAPAERPGR